MSKEDTAPGLLSKMVKFVRNPTTNWSDLDGAQSDREDSMSKQLLKEMIERKRRNDFVRKREFDMLRKMRKREAVAGSGGEGGGRPSFFQSSMPSKPDDRATTLKKIDEIEAQMSMQWWKTKNGGPPDSSMLGAMGVDAATAMKAQQAAGQPQSGGPAAGAPGRAPYAPTAGTPLDERRLPTAYQPTEPASLQSMEAARRQSPPPGAPAANEPAALRGTTPPARPVPAARPAAPVVPPAAPPVVTQVVSPSAPPAPSGAGAPRQPAPPSASPAVQGPPSMGFSNGLSDFSDSKFTAVDVVGAFTHDTELEEAAIRFANGDDSGAEAGLLEILAPGGLRTEHPDTWLTLFDLYRATAQQDKFEAAALQFVERFNRSAPQWFSMPDMVKQLAQPAGNKPGGSGASGNGPLADWVCPSVIGIQTVAALKAALAKASMPWRLDWSNLKNIEDGAVDPLLRVFSGWAATGSQLRFIGDANLQRVLMAGTPSGDRGTAQNRWQLRMEALRVTNRPDDFEMAALDFCVTYEVSPPSWESARCQYRPIDAQGGPIGSDSTIIGDVYRDSVHSSLMVESDSAMSSLDSQHSVPGELVAVELSGQIQGDASAVLEQLDTRLKNAEAMNVSCTKLIRVDFSAAGTLLNWVSARQAEDRTVHFSDVNRLVASFFNVIGITEHAGVTVRVD
jgi:ABC-type transporter Mla MlaB component